MIVGMSFLEENNSERHVKRTIQTYRTKKNMEIGATVFTTHKMKIISESKKFLFFWKMTGRATFIPSQAIDFISSHSDH